MRCLQISALSVAIAGTWATTANAVIKSEVCVQVGTSTVCAVLLGTTECWNEPINECNYSYLLEPSDLEFLFHGNQQVDILDGFGDVSAGDGDGIADDNVKSQTTNKDPCNDAGQSGANAPTVATTLGNPVDISNGQKIETERDFESRGEVPLMLERQYRSYNERDGLFGRYWESNFDHYLWMDGANRIVHIPGRGSFRFTPDASSPNTFRPAGASAQALLVKLTDGSYTLTWDGDTVQRYTSDGRVLSVKNQQGVGYDFTYNSSNRLYRVTATSGRFVQFGWTGTQLTSVTDPAGNVHKYAYLADRFGTDNHLLKSVDYAGSLRDTRNYAYNSASLPGALTKKSVGNDFVAHFSYDASGRATSTKHGLAGEFVEEHTFVYTSIDASTLEVNATNPLGKQAVYRFKNGDVESVTGLPSVSCPASLYTSTKDVNGRPDIVTDFNDRQTDYDYDSAGRLLKVTQGYGTPDAATVTTNWDTATNRVLSQTVAGDHSTAYAYDANGRVQSITTKNLSAVGVANQTQVTSFAYTFHANGLTQSATVDGPLPGNGDAIVRTYSSQGDLLTVSDSLGVVQTFGNYNALGLPQSLAIRGGVSYTFVYDLHGRRTSATRLVNGVSTVSTWTYDSMGRVLQHKAPDGAISNRTYDAAGRMLTQTRFETLLDYDPAPGETATQKTVNSFGYNANSDLIQQDTLRRLTVKVQTGTNWLGQPIYSYTTTDSDAISSFTDYDELGRAKARRGNHGQNVRYGYDDSGYLTAVTDSLNQATSFEYDAQNRIIKANDAKGGITRFTYDAGDRIATVTDPRGLVTRYQYDGFGQLWRLESPDTGVTTFAYDAYGRRTGTTKADLGVTTYGYDSLGRATSQQAGTALQTFSYDACTNGLGRLCTVTDASGSTSFNYTPVGLLAQQINVIDGASYTTGYAYDVFDRLTTLTYPDGKTANYIYQDGRLRSVTATPNGAAQVVADTMRYQPFGPLTSMRYGNGLLRTLDFDTDARLTKTEVATSTGVIVQGLGFTWNANDEITGIANSRDPLLSQSYGYDELGRLTGAGRGDGIAESFGYDAVGNRVSYGKTGQATITHAYANTSNRLTSSSLPRVWTYDANGNSNGFTGADGVAVGLHYDAFGRVDSSSRNQVTTAYKVNALGQRVSKSNPSGTARFIYAPDGSLLAELNGSVWTNYIRANGEVAGLIRNNTLRFVHSDQLARPELVTDSSGAAVWSARNFAFDRTVSLDQIGGLNVGFPGQYFDQETGTWYNYFRDNFDATIGRYLQSDPIGLAGGVNTYAYVDGEPLRSVDPDGTTAVSAMLLIGGCAVSAWGGYSASKTYAELNNAAGIRGQSILGSNSASGGEPKSGAKCPAKSETDDIERQIGQMTGQYQLVTNAAIAYFAPAVKTTIGIAMTAGGAGVPGAIVGVVCTGIGAMVGWEMYRP